MRILVLEMNEEGKKITKTLFAERNDTHVSVIYPKDVSQLVESEPYDTIFIPLKINVMEGPELCRKIISY